MPSIAVVLDPRFKLKYLKFCYDRIYDSCLVAKFMDCAEDELRNLFHEYSAAYEVSLRMEETSNKMKDKCDLLINSNSSVKKRKKSRVRCLLIGKAPPKQKV